MIRCAAAALATILLSACATSPIAGASPVVSANVSPARTNSSPTPAPSDAPFSRLTCPGAVNATHGLALIEYTGTRTLGVLDVSNPLRPALLCWLSPADGGVFDTSPAKVLFWAGDILGAVDLLTRQVVRTARLPAVPFHVAWSPDRSVVAYRSADADGLITTHLFIRGVETALYVQAPLGGHGGPAWGPVDELEFSADGAFLLDFFLFRPATPDQFLVFASTGSAAPLFHSKTLISGVWSRTGHTLYAFDPAAGTLYALDEATSLRPIGGGLSLMAWPQMSPDETGIAYTTWVPTGPNDQCGGLEHTWRFDLTSGQAGQVSPAQGAGPVFITRTMVWWNESATSQCGMGGESQPDGAIVAYDVTTGNTSTVDMGVAVPGIGAPQNNTSEIVDVLW